MSNLLSNTVATTAFGFHRERCNSIAPDDFKVTAYGPELIACLWPRSRITGLDSATDFGFLEGVWRNRDAIGMTKGVVNRWAITGVSRDVYGSALASCTVKLFYTVDDSLVHSTLSDSNGNYTLYTPYTGNHWLMSYKAGTPDIMGCTVNTLTGI